MGEHKPLKRARTKYEVARTWIAVCQLGIALATLAMVVSDHLH